MDAVGCATLTPQLTKKVRQKMIPENPGKGLRADDNPSDDSGDGAETVALIGHHIPDMDRF